MQSPAKQRLLVKKKQKRTTLARLLILWYLQIIHNKNGIIPECLPKEYLHTSECSVVLVLLMIYIIICTSFQCLHIVRNIYSK